MKITILTLFPEMFSGPFEYSIVKRAKEKKMITIDIVNIRDFATDAHKSIDDRPYGGGAGMILRVDVVDRALQSIKKRGKTKTILLDPGGATFTQKKAKELSQLDHVILLCGHYEGVDDRVRSLVDEEMSIGEYVLTGGEIPAMVVVDSIVRLRPGVLKKEHATKDESFSEHLLEYPQYTKPRVYKGKEVPEVLTSGDHQKIQDWQKEHALIKTRKNRPDLLRKRVRAAAPDSRRTYGN